jgi:NDP-sugar pyrophosphorylase family protein
MTDVSRRAEGVARAFVLAGGLGLRLRDVVRDRPKPLALVGGRPFLDYVLCQIAGNGITRVTLCTGHRSDAIRAFAGDGSRWGLDISESVEAAPLGTAGAVRLAWERAPEDEAFVLNGDSFFDVPLDHLLDQHRRSGARATMAVRETEASDRFGAISVDSDGTVLAFAEKGASGRGLINGGIYVLGRATLAGIVPGEPASLERDVFPGLAGPSGNDANGRLHAVPWDGYFIDIGVPADLARLDRDPTPVVGALQAMGAC